MIRRLLRASALALVLVICACVNRARCVEFDVDLGAIDPIGDVDNWRYTLGTSWNDNFSIGGIVGKKNAVITPEVDLGVLGTIDAITADTRTGARLSGRVSGETGLEFFVDFDASRLLQGSNFTFRPTVATPSDVTAGEFFALATSPGLVDDGSFDQNDVHLPSLTAGMDFFFHLDLNSKIEWGLFPIIPYDSTNFNPPEIHYDQRPGGTHPNQSLLSFGFDLNRNPDTGEPNQLPTFTMLEGLGPFETKIGLADFVEGDGTLANLVDKQVRLTIKDKATGQDSNLDIGSVQLVNPFGEGQSPIGGGPNLTRHTSMDDSGLQYSFETPLVRLGLDLDGIAAFLATGESFTRLQEEEIKIGNETIAEVTADLIDIKYGPELGYRESVEINPDFDVTLTFDRPVAVKTGDVISVTSSTPGNWNDLPEISLLDDEEVQVTVTFNKLTGEQTKRGSFYLTDFLELTLLEIEDVTILDTFSHSLPPLVQVRTSLLGKLLGQVELDLFDDSESITGIGLAINQNQTFPLKSEPSSRLYRFADRNPDDPTALADWRSLDDHSSPGSLNELADKVLVIGLGSQVTTHVGELTRMGFHDAPPTRTVTLGELFEQQTGLDAAGIVCGRPECDPARVYTDPGEPIDVQALEIIAGSQYAHFSGGIRRWQLRAIRNDGQFQSAPSMEIEITATDHELLQLTGSGNMIFQGPTAIRADTLFHGEGHSLIFLSAEGLNISQEPMPLRYQPPGQPGQDIVISVHSVTTDDRPLKVTNNIQNAGNIRFGRTNATIDPNNQFANAATATLGIHLGSVVTLDTESIVQDGQFVVSDSASVLHIAGNPEITTEGTTGTFEAAGGGLLRFSGSPKIGKRESLNRVEPPPEKSMTFRAASGGEVRFERAIEQRFDVRSRFETEPGGTMRLNGLSFPEILLMVNLEDNHAFYTEAASQFIEVTNRGTLIVESGRNNLFIDPPDVQTPGGIEETPPVPFVVPINLVNEGTVQIEAGAEFGFQVEIQDYAEGGTKLAGGTWKLMGANESNEPGSNLDMPPADHEPLDPDLAVLRIEVVKVSNSDNILGNTFNIEDFDTELAVNAANVTLSGQAVFPYFNTVRENEGVIELDNYVFNTEGDLLNRGEIRVESGSTLLVNGDLVVDEGTLLVDRSSGLRAQTNTFEVIGGNFTLDQSAGSSSFGGSWIVREKWVGEDAEGNDIKLEGRISFGDRLSHTILGQVTLDGERAVFESLAGLNRIEGKLTLAGGNELRLAQSLNNEGMLRLERAAKLYVDGQLTTSGQLAVGPDTYLDVNGSIHATDGSVELGGLIHATDVTTSATTVLGGSGEFTGSLNIGGPFLATIAESGLDANALVVHGSTMLGGDLLVRIAGYIPQANDVLSILNTKGGLTGAFSNVATGERLETADGIGSFLVHYVVGGDPDRVLLTAFEPTGDYTGDGTFDAADYVLWRNKDGSQVGYNAWRANFGRTAARAAAEAAVPEPAALALIAVASAVIGARRNRGGVVRALVGRIG